ncbi:hypothetical protein H1C71_018693 [Ictidomys tridecemlineatus]|nr:hypothetical protein H1C71_018693 [Ictidomys tridecemlineatus]
MSWPSQAASEMPEQGWHTREPSLETTLKQQEPRGTDSASIHCSPEDHTGSPSRAEAGQGAERATTSCAEHTELYPNHTPENGQETPGGPGAASSDAPSPLCKPSGGRILSKEKPSNVRQNPLVEQSHAKLQVVE